MHSVAQVDIVFTFFGTISQTAQLFCFQLHSKELFSYIPLGGSVLLLKYCVGTVAATPITRSDCCP